MPTYEYICAKCDHHFEAVQSMKDAALTICPKDNCGMKKWGKGKVKKQIGAGAGLIFKGSGFYITEYRSENYKAGEKKDKTSTEAKPAETKPAAESKPSSGESKPAVKKETKSAATPVAKKGK